MDSSIDHLDGPQRGPLDSVEENVDWLFNPDESTLFLESLPSQCKKVKTGRPSISSTRQDLVTKVQEIVTQSTTAAHGRRRDDLQHTFGVSLKQIQERVLDELSLKVSTNTIHRLMIMPNKRNSHSSKYYKGLVNAKVPAKSNSLSTRDHLDFHYTCAQVNIVNELAAYCSDEVIAMSCDDKNKVNIGTPAVHRHVKFRTFFDASNKPNLPDHDFPFRNSKLTPSAYLVLSPNRQKRSRSVSPSSTVSHTSRRRSLSPKAKPKVDISTDSQGRQRITWPRTGTMNVFLHSDKYFPSTSQMHCNHLNLLLPSLLEASGKSVVTAIVDGGPDWRTDCPANIVNFGRVWKQLGLDAFIITSYAPYHSRYNPVERVFSALTKWLAGTILPITLPGEKFPPQQQQGLSKKEKDAKERKVHDRAIELCGKLWNGRNWGGHKVKTFAVPCDGGTLEFEDHAILSGLTSSPLFKLRDELNGVCLEYRFFAKHLTRKTYQLEFVKCIDKTCNHCSHRPVKATRFMSYIIQHGGSIPSPTKSTIHEGHYRTFLETTKDAPHGPVHITENLPSSTSPLLGCSEDGCRYIPASQTDVKRHQRLVHKEL